MCNHSYVMRFYLSPVHGVHGGFTLGGIFIIIFIIITRGFQYLLCKRSMQCLYYYTNLYYLFL